MQQRKFITFFFIFLLCIHRELPCYFYMLSFIVVVRWYFSPSFPPILCKSVSVYACVIVMIFALLKSCFMKLSVNVVLCFINLTTCMKFFWQRIPPRANLQTYINTHKYAYAHVHGRNKIPGDWIPSFKYFDVYSNSKLIINKRWCCFLSIFLFYFLLFHTQIDRQRRI